MLLLQELIIFSIFLTDTIPAALPVKFGYITTCRPTIWANAPIVNNVFAFLEKIITRREQRKQVDKLRAIE